jgi:DNA repair photolyase
LCDNDIAFSGNPGGIIHYLEKCLSIQGKYSIISVSTKSNLPLSFIKQIGRINDRYKNRGFIKLSLSFSCKDGIGTLEPGAALYEDRISLLKKISECNIPTSVILKPVLPFVDIKDYHDIINDASMYTDAVVLGGLYVNEHDIFYRKYIEGKYSIAKKNVLWLKEKPVWCVVELLDRIGGIKEYIVAQGMKYYDSDSEHLSYIMGQKYGNK